MASATTAYLTVMALLITAVASDTPATAYTNHTVGGTAGWFFNLSANSSATNYSSWAANQTFNLGDFLIFNTNTNLTVIQTYNETTYRSCSIDDSLDTDTFQYNGGSNQFSQALAIAVPLTIKGPNYYFSDADDGVQCQKGMAFEITVNQGLGLPPSLNQPPPPPYVEPPSSNDALSPPITVVGNQPNGGSGANVRWVVFVLLYGGAFLLV
ncbi:early nodulin-like protein 18 [Cornus florida]|uniref:early nodulin-like protein 18 n=1 Tax=Cornus florida TaxID=4283 RepID=UPI00289B1C10|nr:early nodulin-like protein 18 [Cornus florida]